uniref:helix-turn-helix transcriptional regulator n=1 Tax=Roseovarius sp. BRH_c41 TaxID=1629709 RepID=UPI0005F2139B|nr:helix-turn-helix domain-containing protein [Roseovarius sp. BRH_c41]
MTQYLTSNEVQDRYKISRSSVYRWQENPEIGFPAPMKIGARILWREAELDAFDARIATASEPHNQPETTA